MTVIWKNKFICLGGISSHHPHIIIHHGPTHHGLQEGNLTSFLHTITGLTSPRRQKQVNNLGSARSNSHIWCPLANVIRIHQKKSEFNQMWRSNVLSYCKIMKELFVKVLCLQNLCIFCLALLTNFLHVCIYSETVLTSLCIGMLGVCT